MTDAAPVATGTYRTRVEWIDTDAAGIYHNATVVRFVEAAEAALMRERGLDGYFPAAPRVRYEVTFEAALRFGQEVTTVLRLAALSRRSMTFEFEIFGEPSAGDGNGDRVRAAHGSYVTVHIDPPTGADDADRRPRSTPWPDAWVRALTHG